MTVQTRTWKYGTRLKGEVMVNEPGVQLVLDDKGEGHILIAGARDADARRGDRGHAHLHGRRPHRRLLEI